MKVLILSLLIIAAFAYQVQIVDNKCWVDAIHKTRKGEQKHVWLDMSRFLGDDKFFFELSSKCVGWSAATADDCKGNLPQPGTPNALCKTPVGDDTDVYMNGKNLVLFFNPCQKFGKVKHRYTVHSSFSSDDAGDEHVVNITAVEPDRDFYKTHVRSSQDNSFVDVYGAFGINGQILYYNSQNGTALPFDCDLRAVNDTIFDDAQIIYEDELSEDERKYGKYKLTMNLAMKIVDIFPKINDAYNIFELFVDGPFAKFLDYYLTFTFTTYPMYQNAGTLNNYQVVLPETTSVSAHFGIFVDIVNENENSNGFDMIESNPSTAYRFTFATLAFILASFFILSSATCLFLAFISLCLFSSANTLLLVSSNITLNISFTVASDINSYVSGNK